jgi:hypothetical protein
VLLATLLRSRVAPVVSAYARASSFAPSLSPDLLSAAAGTWRGCACAPRKRHLRRAARRAAAGHAPLRHCNGRQRARARVSGASLCALTRRWCCRSQAAASRAPWLTQLRPLPCSACLAGVSTGEPTRERGTRSQRALARRRFRGARSPAAVAARACVRFLRCDHAAPLGAAQRPARPR